MTARKADAWKTANADSRAAFQAADSRGIAVIWGGDEISPWPEPGTEGITEEEETSYMKSRQV